MNQTSSPVRLPTLPRPKPLVSTRSVANRLRTAPPADVADLAPLTPPPAPIPLPGYAEGGEVEYDPYAAPQDDGAADEERNRREQADALANAGNFAAAQQTYGSMPVPPASPPSGQAPAPAAPTYQELVQQAAQVMSPEMLHAAAGEAAQSGYYENVAPVIRDIQAQYQQERLPTPGAMVQTQAGREDVPLGSEGTLRGQLMGTGGRSDSVSTVPQGYTESPLATAARVAAGPLEVYKGLNVDIPVWSDFARDYAIPAVNAAADPLGLQGRISQAVTGSRIGVGDVVVPVGAADIGLNLATGGGLTGFDDLARVGSRATSGVAAVREALAENATSGLKLPGVAPEALDASGQLGARGIPSIRGAALDPSEARAIREAADSAGLTSWPSRQELSDQFGGPNALKQAKEMLGQLGQNTDGTASRVWSRYEGVGAQLYPETSTARDNVANAARLAYEGRLETTGGNGPGTLQAARDAASGQKTAEMLSAREQAGGSDLTQLVTPTAVQTREFGSGRPVWQAELQLPDGKRLPASGGGIHDNEAAALAEAKQLSISPNQETWLRGAVRRGEYEMPGLRINQAGGYEDTLRQALAAKGVPVPGVRDVAPTTQPSLRDIVREENAAGARLQVRDATRYPERDGPLTVTGRDSQGRTIKMQGDEEFLANTLRPDRPTTAEPNVQDALAAKGIDVTPTGNPRVDDATAALAQEVRDDVRLAPEPRDANAELAMQFERGTRPVEAAVHGVKQPFDPNLTRLEAALREQGIDAPRTPGVRADSGPVAGPGFTMEPADLKAGYAQYAEAAGPDAALKFNPSMYPEGVRPNLEDMPGTVRSGAEVKSSQVDRLMRESSEAAARTEPPYVNVRDIGTDDVLAQAKRLGVDVDEKALRTGTQLTRDGELDKVQKAIDDELAARPSSNPAADRAFDAMWDDEANRRIADSAEKIGAWADTYGGRGGAQNSTASKVADILYTPFGGDISSWLRQDVTRTLNPFRAGETLDVAKAVASGIGSERGYQETIAALKEMPSVKGFLDNGGKLNLAGGGDKLLNRENMYASWMDNVPGLAHGNRAYEMNVNARRLIGLENFANANPKATQNQMQTYANYLERVTGRGTLGKYDDAASKMGPLFTSLRFALSIPERAPYLLPWTRLADGSLEIMGPVWRNAVVDHAGFIATGIGTMALAEQAGLKVDKDTGKIWAGNSSFDIWGGASQYVNMVRQLAAGDKNGVPYPALLGTYKDGQGETQYRGTVAEFVRNKLGPIPGATFFAMKAEPNGMKSIADRVGIKNEVNFLRPDFWDKGSFGIKGEAGKSIDKALSMVTPLWIQDVAKAVRAAGGIDTAEGRKAGIAAGVPAFLGVGVQSYPPRFAERERSEGRNEIRFGDPNKVFGPEIAKLIGKDETYAQLGSREKQLVNQNMEPGELDRLRKEAAANGSESEKALMQRDHIRGEFSDTFDKLQAALKAGEIDPYTARKAASEIEKAMNDTIYSVKLPESDGSYKPPLIQQAETGYRALYDASKRPDGTQDYDALKGLQLRYLEAVATKHGPEFAGRVAFNVLPGVNPNDHALMQFYDGPEMRSAVTAYNTIPVEQKAGFRLENPDRNALLYAGGYVRTLDSPLAVEAYKKYSDGEPQINFNVGFRQEGAVTYRNLASTPLGPQVTQYQALPLDQRGDYLRSNPDLNVLLWQTGHTSHIYSLDAYGKVAK